MRAIEAFPVDSTRIVRDSKQTRFMLWKMAKYNNVVKPISFKAILVKQTKLDTMNGSFPAFSVTYLV